MGGVVNPEQPIDEEILKWLLPSSAGEESLPDIFVVGLQHLIPNKSLRMFNNNKESLEFMQNSVMRVLNAHGGHAAYTIVR